MLSCRIETTIRWLERATLSRNHEIVLMLFYFCSVQVVCCAGYISSKSKVRADKTSSLFTWAEVPSRSSGRIGRRYCTAAVFNHFTGTAYPSLISIDQNFLFLLLRFADANANNGRPTQLMRVSAATKSRQGHVV